MISSTKNLYQFPMHCPSRYAVSKEAHSGNCLHTQQHFANRSELIRKTNRYYYAIMSSVRNGWRVDAERYFPEFYSPRMVSLLPLVDCCLKVRITISPLRSGVLADLYSGHLGVEKMTTTARLTCWWP